MPRFCYVLNNAGWSGHLLWQKLCAAALLPRHGLVAMAFLNTKARLSGPFRIILGLALKGKQPSNPSPVAPQAFVAHWPGGLHPLYGTNPMVRRWLVLCGCWDRLPDPKGHTLNFKPTAFLHFLSNTLPPEVSRHLRAHEEEQMGFQRNPLCLMLSHA